MNAVANRSVALGHARSRAADLCLPPVALGRSASDISLLELRKIAGALKRLGMLASNQTLLSEHPTLISGLTETLAQYPTMVRAHLHKAMKRVAVDNAARERKTLDTSPEKLLGRAERIAATVEALRQNVERWDVDPVLNQMFLFHVKRLKDSVSVGGPERIAR
jgi:hypothetical protein